MQVSILLATYNSSAYIHEQIRSVQDQTHKDWILYIRDDGSTDNTIEILENMARDDGRIRIFEPDNLNLGAARSFMRLLEKVDANYYMFCDHDDVWLPEKIEKSVRRMVEAEKDVKGPVVVHTDLIVVDDKLKPIAESYWKAVGIKPKVITKFNIIQVFNCVTGCTMLFNKQAKMVSLPYNEASPMHDWWIAIKTKMNGGVIVQVNEALIKYRQHGLNQVGAKKVDGGYYLSKLQQLKSTLSGNREKLDFLKKIGGIGPLEFTVYKIFYNIIRKI